MRRILGSYRNDLVMSNDVNAAATPRKVLHGSAAKGNSVGNGFVTAPLGGSTGEDSRTKALLLDWLGSCGSEEAVVVNPVADRRLEEQKRNCSTGGHDHCSYHS
jgi:hypothetical protein